MKLGPYLAKENISPGVFADMIGVTVQAVHRYIANDRVPHRDVMQRIIEHTKGEVQPNDFFDRAVA
jgi:predicted transcriptional regulator